MLTIATINICHGGEQIDRLAEAIALLDWDLLAVQEVDRNTCRSGYRDQFKLLKDTTHSEGYFAKSLDFQGGDYGLALLYRDLKSSAAETIRFPSSVHEPRVAAQLSFNNGLDLVATHLDCHRPSAANNLDSLLALPQPTIIVGDLNLQRSSISLVDDWCLAGDEQKTYPADTPEFGIDHIIFRRRAWKHSDSWTTQLPATDHLALFAQLIELT